MVDLTESSKKVVNMLKEMVYTQKKITDKLHKLKVEQKDFNLQLGVLTRNVYYELEDKIMPFMFDFVKKSYGIDATLVERKNIVYPNGKYDELNIYVEGTKEGKKVFVIGECKAQPGKKDADKFHEMIERVKTVLKGKISHFLVGYSFDPTVENYIRENYPKIGIFKSYDFELKYKKASAT